MKNYYYELDSNKAKSNLLVLPSVSIMIAATTPFIAIDGTYSYSTQSASMDNQATMRFYNPSVTQSNVIKNVVSKKESGKFAKITEQRKVHKFNLQTRHQKPSFS